MRDFDDVYKRNKMRDETLGGKKGMRDEYTGDKIFKQTARNSPYKHPVSKTIDGDHITSGSNIEKRYKDLSPQQRKEMANDRSNIAYTNSSLNRSKGDRSNMEYLADKVKRGEHINPKTGMNMVGKQIKSEVTLEAKAAKYRMNNMFDKRK